MSPSILVKIMCSISHKWSAWDAVPKKEKKNKCYQKRTCERCGQVEKQTVDHFWSEWKISEQTCGKIRTCQLCQATDYSSMPHRWGDWQKQKNCEKYRICLKCAQKEIGEIEHAWDEWKVLGKDPCTTVRVCCDCHKSEDQVKHSYRPDFVGRKEDNVGLSCSQCLKTIPFRRNNQYWCNTCQDYVNIRDCVDCDSIFYGYACADCNTQLINYDYTVK